MISLRPSRQDDTPLAIWAAAVDATHRFLTADDRCAIGAEVAAFLPHVPLTVAVDSDDRVVAFMIVADGQLEALFVDPLRHGTGIGKIMVSHALVEHPRLTVDVNAQNIGAIGFYNRLGFVEIGQSERDGQGRPYPLLHLRHDGATS